MPCARRLSTHITAALSVELAKSIPGELIADVVQGVVDEHRQDRCPPAPSSLRLEARQRLERFVRARSYNDSRAPVRGYGVQP